MVMANVLEITVMLITSSLSATQQKNTGWIEKKSIGQMNHALCFDGKTAAQSRRITRLHKTIPVNAFEEILALFDNKNLIKSGKAASTQRRATGLHERLAPAGNTILVKA